MASSTKGTKGVQIAKEYPHPYTKESAKMGYNLLGPVFSGDLTAQLPVMLRNIAYESGQKEGQRQDLKVASSGMVGPAATKIFRSTKEMAVRGAAGAPLEVWKGAAEFISDLAKIPSSIGQFGKQSGGGGWGVLNCCYVFCAADPSEELLLIVRRYKDEHFHPESVVAQGYKRLALLVGPSMRKYPLVKWLIKYLMVRPMELFAKSHYERDWMKKFALLPVARFWVAIYWMMGKICGEKRWDRYWKLCLNLIKEGKTKW